MSLILPSGAATETVEIPAYHVGHGLYFHRSADGGVHLVRKVAREDGQPGQDLAMVHSFDADGWVTVVSAMSPGQADAASWRAAKALHEGETDA